MRNQNIDTNGIGEGYPTIVSPKQLAEILGVPLKTIYGWSSQGRFSKCARKRGKHLLIKRDCAINEVLNGQEWSK